MQDERLSARFSELKAGGTPPVYEQHPWRHAPADSPHSGEDLDPYALAVYMDGLPYSLNDSVLAFWFVCISTGRRFLQPLLRKKLICRRGCKGWRSIFMMLTHLTWSTASLTKGIMPMNRHDGSEWLESDAFRFGFAGKVMPRRAITVYIKGDWAELVHTHGLPPHSDGMRPCPECPAFGGSLYQSIGHTCLALAWPENGETAHSDACTRCEHPVVVTPHNHSLILDAGLRYSKRVSDYTMCGRLLDRDVPELGLRRDDRLKPCQGLPDIGELENIDTSVGTTVIFWRPSNDTLCRHRNPLLGDRTGLSFK